jgi:hypothetical protein
MVILGIFCCKNGNNVHVLFFSEADIPVVGNVFSFVITKYPPDWRWRFLKVNSHTNIFLDCAYCFVKLAKPDFCLFQSKIKKLYFITK